MTIQKSLELAIQHHQAGRLSEAETIYRGILSREPTHADALHLLGAIALQSGKLDASIELIQRAISVKPAAPNYLSNLGKALREKGQFDESIAACGRAIALKPDFFEAHNNLGCALLSKGEIDAAIAAYQEAVRLKPSSAEAHCNLSNALQAKGLLDESKMVLRQALRLDPNCTMAHWNLALNLLLQGDFANGWPEYEWRWRWEGFPSPRRKFLKPMWDGRDLNGRAILLHAEQGFGDAIQFVRYAPLVTERGGRVIIVCQTELARLLRFNASLGQIVSGNEVLPSFDFHCPLASLPMVFGTRMESIPALVPYLNSDPILVDSWRKRLKTA